VGEVSGGGFDSGVDGGSLVAGGGQDVGGERGGEVLTTFSKKKGGEEERGGERCQRCPFKGERWEQRKGGSEVNAHVEEGEGRGGGSGVAAGGSGRRHVARTGEPKGADRWATATVSGSSAS
jgi:hypothetical protein